MAQTIGIVLAGGAGRRLGGPKGELLWEGRPLAERAADLLWPLCADVLISTRPGAPNPAPAYQALPDPEPAGRGPLAGIAAAFAATRNADLLVLACDYPKVDGALLGALMRGAPAHDVILPTDARGVDHPLVALWRRSCEPVVRTAVETGVYKVRAVLPDLEVRRIPAAELPLGDAGQALLNLNTPDDLRGGESAEPRP